MHTRSDATLDTYPVRALLALAASLSLLITLVHLPIREEASHVGWTARSTTDRITLSDVARKSSGSESNSVEQASSPPTVQSRPSQKSEVSSKPTTGNESSRTQSGEGSSEKDVQLASPLGLVDREPQIVGGMGSLYLNINYPDSARAQGIEGSLQLEFTVESDGSVADVQVTESLHPLCVSAAVKGVRSVEFIPAKHDGDPMPVRMQLPVRFKLTNVTTATSLDRSTP